MKAKKIPYFDGKILTFNYEYRGFKYSKEFKKMLKEYGLKVTKIIDNYLDKDIYKITHEDTYYIKELNFIKRDSELLITCGALKKEIFNYKD